MRDTLGIMLISLAIAAAAAGQTVEWTYALDQPGAAPTLYPNETASTGVVITSGSSVILLNGDGTVAWEAKLDGAVATPATVANIDGGKSTEVLVAVAGGTVVCLDASGQERWRYAFDTPVGGFKTLAVADLVDRRGLEIIVGFDDGWLNCLDARGNLVWRFFGDKFRAGGGVAIADVDADGAPEIVYGTDNGHVYCLSAWGGVKWRYSELAPYGRSGPNVADLDGDGRAEVLITRSNVGNATCLIALDGATGAFKWRTQDVMQGYVSNAVGDFDGDGTYEVIHTDKGNHVYCENADGTRRWTAELSGRGIFWAPCIADFDGDGRLEVATGMRGKDATRNACFYVLGDDGSVEHALDLGSGANAAPAVGDIDGDGELELIAVTEGPNQVQVLTWNASGRIAWPSLRGNSRMTANMGFPMGSAQPAPERAAEADERRAVLGQNVWSLDLDTASTQDALVEVAIRARADADDVEPAHEIRTVDVPPGALSTDVPVRLTSSGPNSVSIRYCPSSGAPWQSLLAAQVTPEPADFCDFDGVAAQYQTALETARVSGADTASLRAGFAALRAERDLVREMTGSDAPMEDIAEAAGQLRDRAAAFTGLTAFLARAWRAGERAGHFAVWKDVNPWDTFDPTAIASANGECEAIALSAYQNEFENVALTLRNLTTEPFDVRCMFMEPGLGQERPKGEDPEARAHVTLRRVVPVATAMSDRVFDALPELDRSRAFTLPVGEARQLWIEIDTRGLEPGEYEWNLYLGSLTKPPTIRVVPLRIEVWPVALPLDVFAKMNWDRFDAGTVSDQAVRDMIDHNISVIYGPGLPGVPVDADGNLAGEVDWTRFDETLARVPKHFTMLWGAPPARRWPESVAPEEDSDVYINGIRTAIHAMADHLEARGFGYDQWAFYPIDEPWNTGFQEIPHLKHFCETIKRAEPRAQNYTDPAGLVRVEYLDEFKDLIDIWQPELNLLKRDPALVAWFQQHAKRFWAYEAPGPAKDWKPLGHYRGYGWLAWHFGLEGLGYWVYRGVDVWWPVSGCDYSAVYQTNDEVVPSRRWQADRDGVEDYRAFYVLSQEIAQARKDGRTADADTAEALIEKALDEVVRWQIGSIDEITRMTRDYEIDFDLLCDYRTRIAEAIMRLREKHKR
ncbi:MAG: PQQ-binding-like beta-propeller repeat protein [Nitrospiraceae bacterium]|nr:PQQ-binding-like beta-propeller repeat protein [Nitrospiraceae bacterium]